jgi:hypothetical protein
LANSPSVADWRNCSMATASWLSCLSCSSTGAASTASRDGCSMRRPSRWNHVRCAPTACHVPCQPCPSRVQPQALREKYRRKPWLAHLGRKSTLCNCFSIACKN